MKVITNGKVEMPPFGKKLTRQQIAELVTYIHRFTKPTEQKSNQ